MAAPGQTRGRACAGRNSRVHRRRGRMLAVVEVGSQRLWPFRSDPLGDLFSLLFFLGVQVIFSSFFISMLGISRGTYIGDYDNLG